MIVRLNVRGLSLSDFNELMKQIPVQKNLASELESVKLMAYRLSPLADADSPLRFAVPTAARFAAAMAALGVDDRSRVVLYDRNRAMWAARVWWSTAGSASAASRSRLRTFRPTPALCAGFPPRWCRRGWPSSAP